MLPFTIYPTGDSSVTIDLGPVISEELNRKILAMASWLKLHAQESIKEIVTAYSSLCIHFDFMHVRKLSGGSNFEYISHQLKKAFYESEIKEEEKILIKIPVCYDADFGLDQDEICSLKNLDRQEIIRLHMSVDYRIYMIGFLPGFPYMGTVDPAI